MLPPFALQVTPEIFYAYQRTNTSIIMTAGGTSTTTTQDIRNDLGGADLTLRLGLPWEAQAQVIVPYLYEEQRVTTGDTSQTLHASGLGDVQVGLSKQFLEERSWTPALLASLDWKTTTGGRAAAPIAVTTVGGTPLGTTHGLSLGSGFDSLQGALTASKRQDPLVLFGSLGYTANFPTHVSGVEFDPSNTVSFEFGTALAASPATSLQPQPGLCRGKQGERREGRRLRRSSWYLRGRHVDRADALGRR